MQIKTYDPLNEVYILIIFSTCYYCNKNICMTNLASIMPISLSLMLGGNTCSLRNCISLRGGALKFDIPRNKELTLLHNFFGLKSNIFAYKHTGKQLLYYFDITTLCVTLPPFNHNNSKAPQKKRVSEGKYCLCKVLMVS